MRARPEPTQASSLRLLLRHLGGPGMNPPSMPESTNDTETVLDAIPVLADSVRGTLVGMALGITGVFVLAALINPYETDGTARNMGTHKQLGLADCGFLVVTGLPCPSCGMTTSFALLVRGDLINSLRANTAGTLLAILALLGIPWCLISAWRRQPLFFRSIEWTLFVVLLGVGLITVLRWMIVVAWTLSAGGGAGG